jgi:uncharacterized membrane protein (UPF0127 family)
MHPTRLVKDGVTLMARVEVADTPLSRMVGLLGRKGLGRDAALHITPCNAIHTFFMGFALDLVFLDAEMRVTRVVRDVGPGRMVFGGRGAHSVIELESGWLPEGAVKPGDAVTLDPCG